MLRETMKSLQWCLFFVLFAVSTPWRIQAQDSAVTVPDVTGLTIPAAVARLNEIGLAEGVIRVQITTGDDAVTPDLIISQALNAGDSVAPGTSVDLTVLRLPNTTLIYDDNDLTLVNRTPNILDMRGVVFAAADGASTSFSADRWGDSLRANLCTQIWSVARLSAKEVEGCAAIQNWLSTQNDNDHFWIGSGGTTQFSVSQNGEQRAVCAIAPGSGCELYIDVVMNAAEITAFVHFAYTQNWWVLQNTSTDQWMTVDGFTIFSNSPMSDAIPLMLSDPLLYERVHPVARVNQLAPGQCLLFLNPAPTGPLPTACLVAGQITVAADATFWATLFEFESLTDSRRRNCLAATLDRITVCIMPR
jgi:hypothetical protein